MTGLLIAAQTPQNASTHGGFPAGATAALIAAAIALVGLFLNGVRNERNRRRALYAGALAATYDYREFAYVVRRRQASDPPGERIRISEALRVVQRSLDHHAALLRIERSQNISVRYRALVAKTREIAGGDMRTSWAERGPIDTDAEMNIEGIDFSAIDQFVEDYLRAVRGDLSWTGELRRLWPA